MDYLEGGRVNQIARVGNTIHRPAGVWTPIIHKLLRHLRSEGFLAAPEPLGFDGQGNEIVSYIPGEVSNYPLSQAAQSREALVSAAKLLRAYHDVAASFVDSLQGDEPWLLPARQPMEVICHGDYAPYNVVLNGNRAAAIIDFDTAHPGPRVWDIAYALYRWAPLHSPENREDFADEAAQIKRARIFCEAYGLSIPERRDLISMVIKRLQALLDFMISEAEAGNETFIANMAEGHHLIYQADVAYLKAHRQRIQTALMAEE